MRFRPFQADASALRSAGVGERLLGKRRDDTHRVRGRYVRGVVAVVGRVVTVLVGAALVLDVIMAMAMIMATPTEPAQSGAVAPKSKTV